MKRGKNMNKKKRTLLIMGLVMASAIVIHMGRSGAKALDEGMPEMSEEILVPEMSEPLSVAAEGIPNTGYKAACLKSAAARTGADQKLAGKYHVKYSDVNYVCYFKFTQDEPKCVAPQAKPFYTYKMEYPGGKAGTLCLFPNKTHEGLINSFKSGVPVGQSGWKVVGSWEQVAVELQ